MSKLTNTLKAELASMYANNRIDVVHSSASFHELDGSVYKANDDGFYSIVLNVRPKATIDDITRYKADAMEMSCAELVLRVVVEYKGYDVENAEPDLSSLRLHTNNPIQIQGDTIDGDHWARVRFDREVGEDLSQALFDTFLEQQSEADLYKIIKSACDKFIVYTNNVPF